jgi:NADPH2:quinone reductase
MQVIKIPPGVTDEDAAGVFLAGMTALTLINEAFPVQAGQTVLVQAAAGGLGMLLCQALHDRGAVVIGTAGTPEKCQMAMQYGTSYMIDYRENKDWVTSISV